MKLFKGEMSLWKQLTNGKLITSPGGILDPRPTSYKPGLVLLFSGFFTYFVFSTWTLWRLIFGSGCITQNIGFSPMHHGVRYLQMRGGIIFTHTFSYFYVHFLAAYISSTSGPHAAALARARRDSGTTSRT